MRVLTADQGNTTIRFALFEDKTLMSESVVSSMTPEEILPLVESWNPEGGIFSSVGRFDIRFVETLRQLVDDRLLVLTPHTPLPIKVEYDTPETLGVDRLATAVGGYSILRREGGVIADCGTAITIDLLKPGGVFAGGRISPGVKMRFAALHEHTARLPLVGTEGDTPVAGLSTETSLRSGVVRGVAGELVSAAFDYRSEMEIQSSGKGIADKGEIDIRNNEESAPCNILLTGGDSDMLAPFVESYLAIFPQRFVLKIIPNLLNIGLLTIYYFNLEKDRDPGDQDLF